MNTNPDHNKELLVNYHSVLDELPQKVQLVAVSKTHPVSSIQAIYDEGQRVFGENKVQEMVEKEAQLPKDIEWQLIGHLQTNKVKYIAEFIDTIQSVDSKKLLLEINKQANKFNRKIKVLLQVKIAEEESKFGLEISEAEEIFENYLAGHYPDVFIVGLMGLATNTDDQDTVRNEFLKLKLLFDQFSDQKDLRVLSMGMSGDYELAIECGANSVRIGSAIFGQRNYNE